MTLTPSMMIPLGTPAPEFTLSDADNNLVSLRDFDGASALLVVFMSHHCPYTRHILSSLIETAREYQSDGLATVGINSNDPSQHAADTPERMAAAASEMKFPFPFLIDSDQGVAKAFQAACTPDFFLFDKNHKLVYRGRYDDSRPDNYTPTTGDQLRAAIEATLAGKPPLQPQKPSVGCNIKWKPHNEPDYFLKQQRKSA